MAQVSYGTITITDTNDIESITIEYARNQDPLTAPTSGWNTTRPDWAQGYYIWQRTRIHKTGTSTSTDTFGAAVCLTGSTGQTGNTGQSLTATKTQYTHVASNVTITTSNHTLYTWTDNVPEYDSTKPVYWGRITNTYSNPSKTEYIVYKDNGLTEAIAQSVEANANASEALDKANEAESIATHANEDAQGAMSQAANNLNSVVRLWYAKSNSTAPAAPTSGITTGSASTYNAWSTVKPADNSSYQYYFYCDQSRTGGGVYSWSDVVLDTSTLSQYQIGALTAKVKNFWWDSNGAHVASGKNGNEVTTNTISTYGYHALMGLTGISFNYDSAKVVDLNSTTPSLDFYQPPTISGSTVTQGKKTMMLSANALRFYNPADGTTEQAVLDTNGLILKKGGVKAGTANQSGFIYLSTENYGSNLTINNHQASNWREIIGTKFGVDADGNLYASNAEISGKITVTNGSDLSAGLGDYLTTTQTQSYVTGLGYQTSSQVNSIIEGKGYALNSDLTTEINQRKAQYGTSSTSASTRAKVVTCANFELVAGNEITVKFSTANTYTSNSIQLNVNNKGVKDVWVANAVTSSTNQLLWGANAYITFRYDGTQFIVIGEPRAWYGASTTAAATAAKTDTTAVTGCVICKGTKIELAMSNNNTSTSATLNIQSTGAKAIYYGNTTTRPTVDNGHSWLGSSTATFTFDGAYYRMAGQTVISGDSITTGTISANRLNISDIISNGSIAVTSQIPTDLSDLNNDTGYITSASVPTKVSQLTNDSGFQDAAQIESIITGKGYQTSSDVNSAINTATSGLATKSDAVYRTQRIYYRKTSSGAPGKNTTWLASSGTGYGNWSTKIPQLTSGTTKYPYLYTAVQTQTITQYNGGSGTSCSCSDVLLDDSTTVIDGGSIITGSITANEITGNTLSAIYADMGAITAGSISRGNNSINFNQDLATLEFKNASSWSAATQGIKYDSNGLAIKGAITATSLTLGSGVQISASTDISGLATVATSGNYNDLTSGKPDLTVYIQKDGTLGTLPASGATSSNTTGFKVSSTGLLTASNALIYGTIYASAGKFAGSIEASSGYISSSVKIGGSSGTSASDVLTNISTAQTTANNASYSIEIKVDSISYENNSVTLTAVPYYKGSTVLPSGVTYTYQWYKGTTALVNTTTAPTISGATTKTLTLGAGADLEAIYVCVISK